MSASRKDEHEQATKTTESTATIATCSATLPHLTIQPATFHQLPTLHHIITDLHHLQQYLDDSPVEWYHRVIQGGAGDCSRARRIEW